MVDMTTLHDSYSAAYDAVVTAGLHTGGADQFWREIAIRMTTEALINDPPHPDDWDVVRRQVLAERERWWT